MKLTLFGIIPVSLACLILLFYAGIYFNVFPPRTFLARFVESLVTTTGIGCCVYFFSIRRKGR